MLLVKAEVSTEEEKKTDWLTLIWFHGFIVYLIRYRTISSRIQIETNQIFYIFGLAWVNSFVFVFLLCIMVQLCFAIYLTKLIYDSSSNRESPVVKSIDYVFKIRHGLSVKWSYSIDLHRLFPFFFTMLKTGFELTIRKLDIINGACLIDHPHCISQCIDR